MKKNWTVRALLGVTLALVSPLAGCGGDDFARSIGESCVSDEQCESNLCYNAACMSPAGDADGDGLTNEMEALLGTSAVLADSDKDGIGDETEVGLVSEPLDSDGDGVIDALESSIHDDDCDGFVDEQDADTGESQEACVPVDTDGDGEPDANLPDKDEDGVEDLEDCEPADPTIQRTCPPSDDSCTTVTCVPGKACVSEPYDCPVGDDPCVTRTCDGAGGCDEQPTECAPSDDLCATAACDVTSGECTLIPVACDDDGDPCSIEACAPETGECTSTPVVCAADDELCTTESCDSDSGQCVSTPVLCGDDDDPCTVEACDPADGTCLSTPILCEDDGLACTTESCSAITGECQSLPIFCIDDGNPCTDEACEEATGLCAATPVVCPEDTDACTTASCDPASGCGFVPLECPDDGNACTIEGCVPENDIGCSALIAICDDDGDPCTVEACDEALGCIAPEKDCDDQNPCTVDSCDDGVCGGADKDCDDQNPCTTDSCDETSGECVHAPISCADDDSDACTTESCNVATGECAAEPINCDTEDACTTSACEPETGECSPPSAVVCDDENPCTGDSCDSEMGCVTTALDLACDDGFACTVSDTCIDGACVGQAVTCDDSDPCTSDACDEASGICAFIPVDCDDSDLCTADVCDPETGECSNPTDWGELCVEGPCLEVSCLPATGCQFEDKVCDDGDPCTADVCDLQDGCVSSLSLVEGCEDHACWVAGCVVDNEGLPACQYEVSAACDDGDPCTSDDCAELAPDEFGCLSTALSPDLYCPPDLPACTYTTCTENAGSPQCAMGSNSCDDGIACTLDICDDADGTCSNTPNDALCDVDDSPCTEDVCEPGFDGGCVTTPVDCGGDVCNPMTCVVNENLAQCVPAPPPCDDDDLCTTLTCDEDDGCVVTSEVTCDGEACTTATCEPTTGECGAPTPLVCDDGLACTDDTCDPAAGGCVFTPNDAHCDDDNPCTADTCVADAGGCLNGPVDPQAPHLMLTGPPSEGFGAAVWNTSGPNVAADEPPQTNHLPPFGCGGGPVYQYMASPDYDGTIPGSAGSFYATDHGGALEGPNAGLQTFVAHIEAHGYTLADLTFRYTVVNLGDDIEGLDWGTIPPWLEWRKYTSPTGTFTFNLGGEPMVGGDMTEVEVNNDYAGCDPAAQLATVYIHDLIPTDVTTAATPQAVRTAASHFIGAFSQPFSPPQVSLCGYSEVSLTLETFNNSENGRMGGLFGMDGGLLIRPPITGGLDDAGGGTGFD